jgi:hypothetical protein
MKQLLITSLLLLSTQAQADIDWSQNPYDKATHIAIGGLASCAVTKYTDNPFLGFLTGTIIGIVKESTDKNFDNADLASWAVGGAIGTICINF